MKRAALGGLAAAAILVVAGCGTPTPINELARMTSANVSLVKTKLEDFAEDSRGTAALRAATIARLDRRVSETLVDLDATIQAMQTAGQSEPLAVYRNIRALALNLAEIDAEAAARETRLLETVRAGQARLEGPSAGLGTAARHLTQLARERDAGGTLAFFNGFFGEVAQDIEKIRKAQKEAKEKSEKRAQSVGAAREAEASKGR